MRNFSLSLYAFHLRHTLTDAPNQGVTDAPLLWDNLTKLGKLYLPFPGLQDLKSQLICYQNGNYAPEQEQGRQTKWLTNSEDLDLGSIATSDGFKINGNLQPFRLNDTYAADLTLSPEDANLEITVQQLQHFQPKSLLPQHIQASLGQTLWLYAEVEAQIDCKALAEQLATALLAGTPLNPVLVNQDQLFGSLLFDYLAWEPQQGENPVKQTHILISLNNSQANTPQLAAKAYNLLRDLLCCWHKIRFVYHEAGDRPLGASEANRYPEARKLYSQLEQEMQGFPTLVADSQNRLDKLKTLLSQIPQTALDYSRCLRDLQAHLTALETNTTNYQKCLEKIRQIGDIPPHWQKFLDTCQLQQAQIKTDINYLFPGQQLFSQTIDTIRGIVEIDQAERDRFALALPRQSHFRKNPTR